MNRHLQSSPPPPPPHRNLATSLANTDAATALAARAGADCPPSGALGEAAADLGDSNSGSDVVREHQGGAVGSMRRTPDGAVIWEGRLGGGPEEADQSKRVNHPTTLKTSLATVTATQISMI